MSGLKWTTVSTAPFPSLHRFPSKETLSCISGPSNVRQVNANSDHLWELQSTNTSKTTRPKRTRKTSRWRKREDVPKKSPSLPERSNFEIGMCILTCVIHFVTFFLVIISPILFLLAGVMLIATFAGGNSSRR